MSNLDKNIIITPNVGSSTDDPKIVFYAANTTSNSANITMRAYPTSNGTLSFEGSAGQLFSVTNQLTGTLFSVNDISGIPSIEVLDTGRVNLAQYNGTVVIGANTSANVSTSNTTGELVVYGGVGVTGNIYVGGTNAGANGIYTDVLRYAANGLPWVMGSGGGGSTLDQYARDTANAGYFQANGAFIRANAAFDAANVVAGGLLTSNARITIIEGVDVSQNVRIDYSNAAITIIQGVDVTQNTRLTVNEGVDLSQNVRLDYSNTAITIIQGTDTTQNSRMTIIEGTDVSQNARMTIIEGVDVTQNAATAATNQYATSAFSTANNAYNKANNALANTTGTFAGTLTVTGNVIANSFITSGSSGNISGANFVYANTFVSSNAYIFPDGSIQTTAASASLISGAYNQANTATVLAQASYNQANVTIGVDTTQNSRMTIIEGTDVSQNARMTIADGVDASQNVRIDYSNAAITIIQGTDTSQNARMTIIEGVDVTQNTNIANKLSLTGALNQTVSGNVTISSDLIVAGNLIITGNINSQNVQQLTVADPLIVLGVGNYVSDTKDIGFAAHYNDGTNAHAGLFRDSGTKEFYVFQGYTPEVDAVNNIIITDPTFRTANLNANVVKANLIATTAVVGGLDVNSRLDYSNTAITIIQGTDVGQNNRMTIIEGVDVGQNSRMTVIEGTNASQNVRLDYSNTAINQTLSAWTANTVIVANSAGYLSNSNSFFVASNNAIVVPNVVITQAATASFPLSFGQALGNKIALYNSGNGAGYGFGIQNSKLQIFHNSSTDHTSFGHGSSSGFTETFRVASVASAVNYLQATGNTTSNAVTISAQGSDTNVDLYLQAKGLGSIVTPNKLWIAKSNTISSGAPTTITLANYYATFGAAEYGTNSYRLLGFGYLQPPGFGNATWQFPAYMGFQEISSAGATYGDLIFGTRNTTGNADVPITRMRINANGSVILSNTAFDTLNVASGGILANTVLINQRYDQGTVNVGSTLQVTGNVAANGSILAQNLYVQGGSNWLLQSVNLQSASWSTHSGDAGATTVTASLVVAPDGTTTAWQLNNSGGQTDPMRGIFQAVGSSTGPWIASVWLRAGTLSSARVSLSGGSDDSIVANTLVTLTSSWQRVVISGFTGLPYSTSSGVRLKLSTNAATGNYLVWGPQIELANPTSIRSVASPYIPTSTSSVIASNNNIYVTNTVASANLVVSNIVGFANSNNIVSVYQSYNSSTNSLDVVFG